MAERYHAYMFSQHPEPPEDGWLTVLDDKLAENGGRRVSDWTLESVSARLPGIPDEFMRGYAFLFLFVCDAERVAA